MHLINRLTTELGYPLLVDKASLEAFAKPRLHTVIFLQANPQHYPETLDVAVVLPELMKVFKGRLHAGVADPDFARELAAQYAITEWPALLFLRHGGHVGSIARMRDWDVYLHKINALLMAEPSGMRGIGIPVVSA